MRLVPKQLIAALAAAPLAAGMSVAMADYPDKPVRIIVAFPAGGSADIVARMVSDVVARSSDFDFIVENRTGAGGNIAFEAVSKANPDGYTLLFSTPGIAINPSLYANVNFKTEEFTPITLVGEAPLMLMVRPDLPINTIAELVEASQEAPDAIRFASSGNGSSSHLAGEVFRAMTDMQYLHVPYRGGGAAMADMMGGRTDITFLPIAESMPYVNDNRLRALGQTGSARSPIAADIPTIAEGGVEDYSVATWYMLVGPAGLPDNVVNKLHDAFSQAVATPELAARLEERGVNVINANPADTAAFLKAQADSWAVTIEGAGIRLE